MKKKKASSIERTEKRVASMKATERDRNFGCRVGMPVELNNKTYFVIVTTKHNIYLIDKNKKVKQLSWSKWKKKLKFEIDNVFCVWNDDVVDKICEIVAKNKKREKKARKVNRKPRIKRTPMKKKKVKRTPMKKKVKRTPTRR